MHKFLARSKNKVAGIFTACMLAMYAPFAFAGAPTIDTSSITALFDDYKVAAVGLLIAFVVVLWALRATGLLKPRG